MKTQNSPVPNAPKEWVCNKFDKFLLWASAILNPIIAFYSLSGSGSGIGVALFYIAMSVLAVITLNETVKNGYIIKELYVKVAYVWAWFIITTFTLGFVGGLLLILAEF